MTRDGRTYNPDEDPSGEKGLAMAEMLRKKIHGLQMYSAMFNYPKFNPNLSSFDRIVQLYSSKRDDGKGFYVPVLEALEIKNLNINGRVLPTRLASVEKLEKAFECVEGYVDQRRDA